MNKQQKEPTKVTQRNIIPLLRFQLHWQAAEEDNAVQAGFTEKPKREWIVPHNTDEAPPDQFLAYIENCIEPLDLNLGAVLAVASLDPELKRKMGDRLIEGLAQIMLAERAVRSRPIIEVNALGLIRSMGNAKGLEALMGKELMVGLIWEGEMPVQVIPPPEMQGIELPEGWGEKKPKKKKEVKK